jgi:DNA-binding transcriptional regulator PaaX
MTETRSIYRVLIDAMPAGLERSILRTLSYHPGRERAISRTDLVQAVASLGFDVNERVVREAIKGLRRAGHLIGSAAGESGGYYVCVSLEEYEDFDRQEFEAKISDMSLTRAAMKRAAREQFGEGTQMGLFG